VQKRRCIQNQLGKNFELWQNICIVVKGRLDFFKKKRGETEKP
jgi:hypothetical protein